MCCCHHRCTYDKEWGYSCQRETGYEAVAPESTERPTKPLDLPPEIRAKILDDLFADLYAFHGITRPENE